MKLMKILCNVIIPLVTMYQNSCDTCTNLYTYNFSIGFLFHINLKIDT